MYRLLLLLLIICCPFFSKGEGTKELCPTAADFGGLMFNNTINDMPMGLFTPNTVAYPAGTTSVDYRINIRISNLGEVIYVGFTRNLGAPIFFRIKDPTGVIVVPNTIVPVAGPTYAQMISGPIPIVGATGYTPIAPAPYTPTMTGDYYIEFNSVNGPYSNTQVGLQYFDITVASASNIAIPGRLWSRAWQLTTFANPNRFSGSVYAYSKDSIVNRVRFNGMLPFTFGIVCNSFGVFNTGNNLLDRRSVQNGLAADPIPEYQIFLNDPDISSFPTGTFGNITGSPSISGCAATKCINLTVDKAGKAEVILDLNGTAGYQLGTSDLIFNVTLAVGLNCIPWDGLDGLGNPVPNGTSINVLASYQNSLFHMPLFDIENNNNGFQVSLVRPAGPSPLLFWDDSQLLNVGTFPDGKVNLVGCNTVTPGCHRWTNKGNNACMPCPEIINTWWYSNSVSSSTLTTALDVSIDANSLTIGTGFPNNNFSICSSTLLSTLNGLISGPPSVTPSWTSTSGSTFTSATASTPGYSPSAAAIAAGFDILFLEVTGAVCPVQRDSILITIVQEATSFAGVDKTVCQNNANTSLLGASASIGAFSLSWSGGSGSYAPNSSTLVPVYSPGAAELTSGSATLTLTVTPTDPTCPPISDALLVTIAPAPSANAGPDAVVCANNNLATASAIVNNATSLAWVSSSSCVSCFSTTNAATTNYSPIATDLTNTNVTLTVTASRAGCIDVSDNMTITYDPAPVPNAGPDLSKCKNKTLTSLIGAAANSTSVSWSSSSLCNSCFSSLTNFNTTYLPSTADTAAGSVFVILTGMKAGCNPEDDTMTLVFTTAPSIDVGTDVSVCTNNPCFSFNATEQVATGIQWSNVSGTFVPDATSLSGTYCLTPAEIISGTLKLIGTTTGNGNCNAVKDSLTITVTPAPTINAGSDQSVCASSPCYNFNVATSNATGIVWSGGLGAFAPGINSMIGTYCLSPAEIGVGVTITATTVGVGNCNPVSDQIQISVISSTIDAGNDTSVCANSLEIPLEAAFGNFSSIAWTSSGSGAFSNSTAYQSSYELAANDNLISPFYIFLDANSPCGILRDTVSVTFSVPPIANAGTDLIAGASGQVVSLAGTGSSSGALISYNWSSPNGTVSFNAPKNLLTNAIVEGLPSTAILQVLDSTTMCFNSDTVKVFPIEIEIPNIFSPNGDGVNDQFKIKNIEFFPNAELKIYDQWSNMIFSANPAHSYFWDGKIKEEEGASATYYYTLDLKVKEFPEMKGNVTLVR
jgi:gliding motility-associated-like protein